VRGLAVALVRRFGYDCIVKPVESTDRQHFGDLIARWRRLLENGSAGCGFDLEKLEPGRFCVLYRDGGGESMACYSEVQVIGFFDNERDFLAFLRCAELPRVMDVDTGTNRDPFPDVADAYLLNYEGEERDRIDRLVGMIDSSLKAETITVSELSLVCGRFNEAFSETNPSVQLIAWGSLPEVLRSGALQEALEEAVDEEVDDEEQPCTRLRALLDDGKFDENDEEHLALVRGFLERLIVA